MERYFTIAFLGTIVNDGLRYGEIRLKSNSFPSRKSLVDGIEQGGKIKDVAIVSIFEFQTAQDYNDYNAA